MKTKTQKSTRQLMALVLFLMLALVLTACGDSSTANPIAVSTAAATTTNGQAISTTNGETISLTSPAVSNPTTTNTMATTAAKVSSVVTAAYPNATSLNVSQEAQNAIVGFVGDLGIKDVKYQTFLVTDVPVKVFDFYVTDWQKQGVTKGTQVKMNSNKMNIMESSFYKDSSAVGIVTIGPVDNFTINYLTTKTVALDGKIKVGDNILVLADGSKDILDEEIGTSPALTEAPFATTEAAVTTTAQAKAASAVIATYPNAKALDVAQTSQQAFGDSSGALDIKDAKYQTFVVTADPSKIATFYEADLKKQGFQQGSVVKSGSFDVTTLREVCSTDSSKVAIVAVGPMDASYLEHIAPDTEGLKDMLDKVKVGDTLFVIVSGSK